MTTIQGSDADYNAAWQSRCGIQKIVQTDAHGCGIACLAMVSGIAYKDAREIFIKIGLGHRRSCRPAFSTSSREMQMAIASVQLHSEARRWRSWTTFNGLGILKVRDDWRGAVGKWHWVVAFRHEEFGLTVFDPHMQDPTFEIIPQDVPYVPIDLYQPKGEWFQVEQRVSPDRTPSEIPDFFA